MPKLPRRMLRRAGVYYWQGTIAGKRKPISLRTRNRDEARLRFRELERRYVLGGLPESDTLVRDAIEVWLKSDVASRRREKDQRTARTRADRYFLPRFGAMRVGAVQFGHLEDYRRDLEGRGLRPATVVRILHDARRFFNWAERRGYVGRSPFLKGLMPKVEEPIIGRLSDEDMELCRTKLKGNAAWTYRFLLDSGMRWGEAVRAKIGDVDFKLGQIEVPKSKSGRPRAVPLAPDILADLPAQVLRHGGGRIVPYSEKSSGSFAKTVMAQTGIEGFRAHLLRHTCGRWYLEHGGELKEVQQLLGHESIATTLRYTRLSDAALRRARERVRSASETTSVRVGTGG